MVVAEARPYNHLRRHPAPAPPTTETPAPPQDEDEDEDQPGPVTGPAPDPIRDTLTSLLSASDKIIDANTIDGSAFHWNVRVQPTPSSLTLADITRKDDDPLQSLGVRRGVNRAIYQRKSVEEFSGWMDHSFFFVSVWNPTSGTPLNPSESTFSHVYSVGEATGSNPTSGGATWTGVMAGIDERENRSTFGNLVEGDAQVRIDNFSAPAVDVMLSNIRDRQTGDSHSNISWDDVPLTNGAFSTSSVNGQFYGPNHEEVGGIFLRNNISGAFGAKHYIYSTFPIVEQSFLFIG